MNKLEQYSKLTETRKEFYKTIIRAVGKFSIGPTNRGGIWLRVEDKDIMTDISPKELAEIRDLITDFLVNVVGEK